MTRWIFLILCIATGISLGQETLMRIVHDTRTDTHVEVLALFTEPVPGGYLPVRITLANNQNRQHRVELRSQISSLYGGQGSRTATVFTVVAEPGRVVTRDVLIPTLPAITTRTQGSNMSLHLSGTMGNDEHFYYQNTLARQPRILLSRQLHTVNASSLDSAAVTTFGSSHRGGKTNLASRFDPKQLPSEWLAYGGYDWMIITDEEWTEIPPGQRNAILAWVRLGGNLDVRYRMDRFERARLGLPDDAGFGTITGTAIAANLVLDAPSVMRGLNRSQALPPRGTSLSEDFDGSWQLQQRFGVKGYQFGLFIAVLAGFTLLVGPVNLFFFAPSGKRHRLFVTTPLISLGASLLMVCIIILQDGFGGNGIRLVLMEVRPDDGHNAAFIHQEQISRTGILTRSGFQLAVPAMIHPVPIAPSRWARLTNRGDSVGNFHLQPTGGGVQVAGDWFQSRSEQGHFISAVTPSRGRIERDAEGGYVSSFPHALDLLLIRDSDGGWQIAEGMANGEPMQTKPITEAHADDRIEAEARGLFTPRLRRMFDTVKSRENHFIAISTSAPGIETHSRVKWAETRTIITGPVGR